VTSLPDRQHTVALVEQAQRDGARLAKACAIVGVSVRTYQRWSRPEGVCPDRRADAERPVPHNKLSELERAVIVDLCNKPRYRSRPPAYIVADQADQGRYLASESTFYRVLRDYDQNHHRGRHKPPEGKRPPTTHVADAPNRLWSWDVSWLPGPACGSWWYLYLIVDVFSRKIVGHEVHAAETGELASELIEKAHWREHLAAKDKPLILHSDNGSPMKAATFLQKLYDLGITPSRSRPRVSNDNAYSEALFRTLKYRPGFPSKGFATLGQAREWVLAFVHWYNEEHRHSALNYVTPAQRHSGEATRILENRKATYQRARDAHPERWPGAIRDFGLPQSVTLNPETAANC